MSVRSEDIAELFLSLVVQPEKAAAVIGDLREQAPEQGRAWFWASVFRTFAYSVARDFFGEPWLMVKLAFVGFFAQLLVAGCIIAPFYFLQSAVMALGGAVQIAPNVTALPAWILQTMLTLGPVVPFLAGWMVANRSDNRELAAAAANIFRAVMLHGAALYLSALQVKRIGKPWPNVDSTHDLWLGGLLLLAGALMSRYRRIGLGRVRNLLA